MLGVKISGAINMAMAISPITIANKAGRNPHSRATRTDTRLKGTQSKIDIDVRALLQTGESLLRIGKKSEGAMDSDGSVPQ